MVRRISSFDNELIIYKDSIGSTIDEILLTLLLEIKGSDDVPLEFEDGDEKINEKFEAVNTTISFKEALI